MSLIISILPRKLERCTYRRGLWCYFKSIGKCCDLGLALFNRIWKWIWESNTTKGYIQRRKNTRTFSSKPAKKTTLGSPCSYGGWSGGGPSGSQLASIALITWFHYTKSHKQQQHSPEENKLFHYTNATQIFHGNKKTADYNMKNNLRITKPGWKKNNPAHQTNFLENQQNNIFCPSKSNFVIRERSKTCGGGIWGPKH